MRSNSRGALLHQRGRRSPRRGERAVVAREGKISTERLLVVRDGGGGGGDYVVGVGIGAGVTVVCRFPALTNFHDVVRGRQDRLKNSAWKLRRLE